MGMMREPVERRRREQRALKQIGPFGERPVRGDDERAAFVALLDHFVEIFRSGRGQRLEAEVVEHQHIGTRVGEQPPLVGAVGPAAVEMAEHAGGGDEDDVEAALTRLVPERLREVRFADAGRTLNEHRLVPFDEPTRGEIEDLLAIDGRIEAEIEALQRLAQIDGRAAQPELPRLLGAPFDFVFDQALEELDVGQFLPDGLLRADFERGQDAGQPAILEFRDELMIQLHGPPPVEGKKSVTGRANSGRVREAGPAGAAGTGV